MTYLPTLFADGLTEASVRNGVARLVLASQGADGKPVPAGILAVPLSQLPGLAGSLNRLLREVEAKARDAAPQISSASAPAAAPAAESAELPPAFRFQG